MIREKSKYIVWIAAATLLLVACENKNIEHSNTDEMHTPVTVSENATVVEVEPEPVEPTIIETDFSSYFSGYEGSAVFYDANQKVYEVYNMEAAKAQRSPCSTFKIISTLAALEAGVITVEDSRRKWSGEYFWNSDWNQDVNLEEAFRTSCIWYYRELIDELGEEEMSAFIDELQYGNGDLSDWEGRLNQNNNNRALTGFWVESSLKISPLEQVDVLHNIFGDESIYQLEHVQTLKDVMKVEQDTTEIDIYGKTGYGKLENVSLDSWFVGMYETNAMPVFFAVHLSESEDPKVNSALAKEIAIQIIAEKE